MQQSELKKIKQKLLQLKAELQTLEEISLDTGKTVELDQARTGRLTRMDAMQAQQMAQESARRRRQQLLLIEAAFKRMETGDYGYCLDCDEEIAVQRLFVDPSNTLCIKCAEKI
ncbi:MAG: TraR/DksA C4-type zinc finger protein [Proteobacteria bacterium]|nr:TraR/DksA C4-type zinc finger protein [Pseudomonadota bacterium]